jgi:hypothetical protein
LGNGNVFTRNRAEVDGPGYGFNIAGRSSGNVVKCDNVVVNAGDGYANVPCGA